MRTRDMAPALLSGRWPAHRDDPRHDCCASGPRTITGWDDHHHDCCTLQNFDDCRQMKMHRSCNTYKPNRQVSPHVTTDTGRKNSRQMPHPHAHAQTKIKDARVGHSSLCRHAWVWKCGTLGASPIPISCGAIHIHVPPPGRPTSRVTMNSY